MLLKISEEENLKLTQEYAAFRKTLREKFDALKKAVDLEIFSAEEAIQKIDRLIDES